MRKLLVTLSLSSALALPSSALAEGGPGAIDAFRKTHEEVATLLAHDEEPGKVRTRADSLLDYEWIAQAALGGPSRYAKRCAARCDEFKGLLTRLIRANYLKRLDPDEGGTVTYVGEHVRAKATKVETKVTFTTAEGGKRTVEVDYVMHKVDGSWHVRDIVTEGVSLGKNYKHEISRLYKDGGMDKVISTLETKLQDLEAQDKLQDLEAQDKLQDLEAQDK